MSTISIIRRITSRIQSLANELEIRNMTNLAQALQVLVRKAQDIEKICMYTNTIVVQFKDLSEKTKNISRKVVENPDTVKEGIEEFVQLLSKAINTTLGSYLKLKFVISTLVTLYTFISAELIRMHIQSTSALIFSSVLLWQGVILILLILMNLTMSIFVIPVVPLTSITFSVMHLNLFEISLKSFPLALHTIALALSLIFIARNINNYSKLKSFLKELEDTIAILADTIKDMPKAAPISTVVIDLNTYIGVYGDKAYELIKYVNDMQKLLGR